MHRFKFFQRLLIVLFRVVFTFPLKIWFAPDISPTSITLSQTVLFLSITACNFYGQVSFTHPYRMIYNTMDEL
jgi:hypothetical protein